MAVNVLTNLKQHESIKFNLRKLSENYFKINTIFYIHFTNYNLYCFYIKLFRVCLIDITKNET